VEERVISKRGLIAAGALATGSVVLAAGSALACSINDFQFDSKVTCSTDSGTALATLQITDKDSSHTAAVIDVYTQNADGSNGTKIATLNFSGANGEVQTVSVPWVANSTWNVVAETNRYIKNPETATEHPTTGNTQCAVEKAPPSASPTPTTSAPAAPVAATSAPATPSPSKSTGTVLAETGGGSNTGLIGGFAAALVVVGGGVLYTVRRRAAAARHN
jgi:hypothetical protein